jgi:hypothetical protein
MLANHIKFTDGPMFEFCDQATDVEGLAQVCDVAILT